jgi:putative SOS response-associated peptidase YedK
MAKLAGNRVRSSAIITTTPNDLCAELHDRMPVIPPSRFMDSRVFKSSVVLSV